MRLPLCCLLLVLLFASGSPATAQVRLPGRVTFETLATGRQFAVWPMETAQLDSVTVHTGMRAVRIRRDSVSPARYSDLSFALPERPAGSVLEVRAWLKTENVKGWAGLLLTQSDTAAFRVAVTTQSDTVAGSNDWKEYRLTVPLDKRTQFIDFGVRLNGVGAIWIDDVKLLIDGKDVPGVVAGSLSGRGCTFAGLRGNRYPGGGGFFEFVFDEGLGIRGDGIGAYRYGVDFVDTYLENSGVRLYPLQQYPRDQVPKRVLTIDLGKPVGGALPRGVRKVNGVVVHWKQDSAHKVISGILDMPVGMTAKSERLEIEIDIDGRRHMLRFGELDLSICWRSTREFAPAAVSFGIGTTNATIHRVSVNEWTIDLPNRSVGRLWEFFGTPPADGYAEDRGYYELDARMTIRRLGS
jgi:hypothetical protein